MIIDYKTNSERYRWKNMGKSTGRVDHRQIDTETQFIIGRQKRGARRSSLERALADRGSIQKILSGNSQACLFVSIPLVCSNRRVELGNINRCEKEKETLWDFKAAQDAQRGNGREPREEMLSQNWKQWQCQRDWQWQGPIEKQLISKWNPSGKGR